MCPWRVPSGDATDRRIVKRHTVSRVRLGVPLSALEGLLAIAIHTAEVRVMRLSPEDGLQEAVREVVSLASLVTVLQSDAANGTFLASILCFVCFRLRENYALRLRVRCR